MDTNYKKTSWEEKMKQEFEKKNKTKGDIHRENKFKHKKKDYQKKKDIK
tara:strand:+ start:437 stop:583 length:147 start_codon:yes stop_codon:yes gene_type:complete